MPTDHTESIHASSQVSSQPINAALAVETVPPRIHPPKPPLAFNVGVIGHQPNRLQHADLALLGGLIKQVLEVARNTIVQCEEGLRPYYDRQPLTLRAISSLAEGTDRIFAEAALDLGYHLCCPMPFPQAIFEQTFAHEGVVNEASVTEFRALLARAEAGPGLTRFELPGSPTMLQNAEARHWGYGRCGRLVYQHCELLVVVWDGKDQNKRSGTDQQLVEAHQDGVPIVLISAQAPHAAWVVKAGQKLPQADQPAPTAAAAREALLEQVRETVCEILALPRDLEHVRAKKEKGSHLEAESRTTTLCGFYAERKPIFRFAVFWAFFTDLLGFTRKKKEDKDNAKNKEQEQSGGKAEGQAEKKDGRDGQPKPWRWPSWLKFLVGDIEAGLATEWPRDTATPIARLIGHLRLFYAWPGRLARLYGDAYRSTFLAIYLLAALAVGCALLPVALDLIPHKAAEAHQGSQHPPLVKEEGVHQEASQAPPAKASEAPQGTSHGHPSKTLIVCSFGELGIILFILGLVWWGRRRLWHERWIDYRLTAELVRHLALVTPLGGERLFLQLPAHLKSYGHPGATWMAWYLRALGRALGLPAAKVDRAYLGEYLRHMIKVLERKVSFHSGNEGKYHRIEHRLHTAGLWTLGLTLTACSLHVIPLIVALTALKDFTVAAKIEYTLHHPGVSLWLTFLCGFLPALGASLVGITNQGEFRRVAKRSQAMAEQLEELKKAASEQLESLAGGGGDVHQQARETLTLAEQASQALVKEVLDWRVVFVDRPLTPPG